MVWNTLQYRLGNDNHIPVVVTYLCIEVLTPFCIAVFIFKTENACVRIECFRACHKLTDCSVLHYNHRLLGCAESAHLHCSGDEGKGFACAYLVCKHKALHCASHYRLGLMLAHLDMLPSDNSRGSVKVFGNILIGNSHRCGIVEDVVVGIFYFLCKFGGRFHARAQPRFEVIADFIYFGGAGRCSFRVGYRGAVFLLF